MKSVCINQGNKCKWEKCWDVKIEFPAKRTTTSLLVWSSCSVLSPRASCKYDRFWHFYLILLCNNNTLLISSIDEQTWDPVDKGFVGKGLNITKYLLLFCDADSQLWRLFPDVALKSAQSQSVQHAEQRNWPTQRINHCCCRLGVNCDQWKTIKNIWCYTMMQYINV